MRNQPLCRAIPQIQTLAQLTVEDFDDDEDFSGRDKTKGTCFGDEGAEDCGSNLQGSHVAGIIGARRQGVNKDMQGLAFLSKMKPIDISGDLTEAQRIAAIREASGMTTRYIDNWISKRERD